MIKAIITDVDGVLTDGGYYYSSRGLIVKKFNTRDASALNYFRSLNKDIKFHVLTSSDDKITLKRLGIMNFSPPLMVGIEDRTLAFINICEVNDYMFSEVAFITDNLYDIPILKKVGVSACPCDAAEPIKKVCKVVLARAGGEGVLEEFICRELLHLD